MEIEKQKRNYDMLFGVLLFLYIIIILEKAWVSDDAFITFRTAYNWIHGYGLRWEVTERVQTFTNPLWLFLMSFFYLFTKDFFYTSILISLFLSSMVIFVLKKISISSTRFLLSMILIGLSQTFLDYSTSGLENPLSHFLLSFYFLLFMTNDRYEKKHFFVLSLLIGLSMVNRMDLILIYIPSYLYILLKKRNGNLSLKQAIGISFIGMLPIILWLGFSLIYYGFLFPNTAYAKLHTGWSSFQYMKQGLKYLRLSLFHDISILTIFASYILVIVKKDKKLIIFQLGSFLYLLYVIKVGGDFMMGRFFSVIFLMSILSINCISEKKESPNQWMKFFSIAMGIYILINVFYDGYEKIYHHNEIIPSFTDGIMDERMYYSIKGCDLLNGIQLKNPNPEAYEKAMFIKKHPKILAEKIEIGYFSYYLGPNGKVLDRVALTDPLLVRMGTIDTKNARIGHFERAIPDGYAETILTEKNKIKDAKIHLYYKHLSVITKDPILSLHRFNEIYNMNFGQYDYLIATKNK